jgi:hypothetical protein
MTPPPPPAPPGSPPPLPPIDWNKFKEKMPSAAQLKEWRDRGQFGVWIDQDKIKNTDLTNYSPENFSYFNVSKLMKNAKNYGKYTYQVNLMTKEQLAKFRRQQKH